MSQRPPNPAGLPQSAKRTRWLIHGIALVIICFALPFILWHTGANAPATLPAQLADNPTAASEPAADAPVILPLDPLPAAQTRWDNLESGCAVTQDAGKIHILGTNSTDGWGHWNGVKTAEDFPDTDFVASVDFKIAEYSGPGSNLTYLRVSAADGNMVGVLYDGAYKVQRWTPRTFNGSVRAFGDEKTRFHRITLAYEAATHIYSGTVDGKPIGKIDAVLTGNRKFWLGANTDRAGTKIDITFQNFYIHLGSPGEGPAPALP
jgi:hypothetical protein